jgi:glycogen synthase
MLATLREAIRVYGNRDRWRLIQQAGMRRDFSWAASAERYVQEYAELLATARGRP